MPKGGKGGCTMTFEQVVLLLTLLGGAIYVTFEITWTVSHSDEKEKMTASSPNPSGHLFLTNPVRN